MTGRRSGVTETSIRSVPSSVLPFVDPGGPGQQRQVRVVDAVDEVGRVDLGLVVAAVARVDDRGSRGVVGGSRDRLTPAAGRQTHGQDNDTDPSPHDGIVATTC